MSGDCGLPKKAVVLRTGGLGDFVLTIPLLVCLIESGCHVTVATRRSYFDIIGDILENITFLDADELMGSQMSNVLSELLEDTTVYSFWKDCDGFLETRFQAFGAQRVVELESRPFAPPHIVERIFQSVGIQWEKEFYKRSWLGHKKRSGDCLWVHPGSGSPTKNVPLAWFLDRIERWLAEETGESVLVSFGEADDEIKEEFRLIGGEPFINDKYIDILKKLHLENLELALITNNSVFPKKWIEYILRVKILNLHISLDGVNEVGEFVRSGMNFKKFTQNLIQWKKLSEKHSNINIKFNFVVHSLNVLNLKSTIKYLENLGFEIEVDHIKKQKLEVDFLKEPIYINLSYLPDRLKKIIEEKLDFNLNGKRDMIVNFMYSNKYDSEIMRTFVKYCMFLEQRKSLPLECEFIINNVL